MPRVRVSPLGPRKENCPLGRFSLCFYAVQVRMRHPANKAGYLLWVKPLCAASGRYSRVVCVQRSIKTRISASPKFLSGTANQRRSRGCREFESRHLDQKETTIFFPKIVVSFCSFHFSLFTFLSSLKLSFPEKR